MQINNPYFLTITLYQFVASSISYVLDRKK